MRALALVIPLIAACEPPGYGHHDPDAAMQAVDAGHHADASPDGTIAGACTQTFQLFGHGGDSSVWLSGDWLTWPADLALGALPLALGTTDGSWSLVHGFAIGTYQYKFIVDGTTWIADPADANVVDDGNGGHNSVYTCN